MIDSREPTLFEDMVGLSTIVHVQTPDGLERGCGVGWHGNLPFILEADFPRFAGPPALPPEDETAVVAALQGDELVRGETRYDEIGNAVIARRRGSDALVMLRPSPGKLTVEPYTPNRDAAGPDQQRWMNYAESYEGLTVLDAWRDGATEDVIVLTGDLSGQIWRHHIDSDGVETWRKTDDDAAVGTLHREHLFPGTLAAADAEASYGERVPDTDQPAAAATADRSLLSRVENYVRALSALRAAQDTVDGSPEVAVTHVRELSAALEALEAHVAAALARQAMARLDPLVLARIEEPLRQELASIRCIIVPPPRVAHCRSGDRCRLGHPCLAV